MEKINKIAKILRNVVINIVLFFLVIVACISVYISVQINILEKEYVNIFGYTYFKVETASMADTIMIGDIVIVKINGDFLENDIISYKENNKIITHRIVKIDNDKIITKGDNNNVADSEIFQKDVIGKVVFVVKNVEIWKMVFKDVRVKVPLLMCIILFVILIIYEESREYKCKKSKKYKISNDNIINIDYLYMYYSNKHNSQIC